MEEKMSNINEIKLAGNLTKDCEVKYLPNGTFLCEFSIAHNFFRKNTNEQWEQIKTIYISCICFAEIAKENEPRLKKGKKIIVTGKFDIDNWTDREGNKKYKNKIIVKEIEYVEYNH
jgi:single-strand DNA-binding protein